MNIEWEAFIDDIKQKFIHISDLLNENKILQMNVNSKDPRSLHLDDIYRKTFGAINHPFAYIQKKEYSRQMLSTAKNVARFVYFPELIKI